MSHAERFSRINPLPGAALALACLLLLYFLPLSAPLANSLDKLNNYDSAGLLYLDDAGRVIKTERANDLLVPASTTKLITAWLGLTHWGEAYRFKTDFYLDESSTIPVLWINLKSSVKGTPLTQA